MHTNKDIIAVYFPIKTSCKATTMFITSNQYVPSVLKSWYKYANDAYGVIIKAIRIKSEIMKC